MRRVIPGLETPESLIEPEIGARLDRVEEELEKAVVADSDLLSATARYLLQAGGKRFRPMLVLLAGYFGDPADPRLIPGSVAIELTHLATLYHDDVIDESDDRRGVPSANARWDNTVAILTGDYLFALASEMSADLGPEVCRLLARTITVLCDGQIREVDAAGRVDQNEEGYLEVIRRKTAKLFEAAGRLGAVLGDADPALENSLASYGLHLGTAFQIMDDVLDYSGDAGAIGKNLGDDLAEGKMTLPLIRALATGTPEEAALIRRAVSGGGLTDFAPVLAALERTGALSYARERAVRESDAAAATIAPLPASPATTTLLQLSTFAAHRTY